MIVSHKHRFIFLKTQKTAGTSIEKFFYSSLGPYDICTGSVLDDIRPMNSLKKSGHVGATQILSLIGKSNFDDYYKFVFERNSYDKAVSGFLFQKEHGRTKGDFTSFTSSSRLWNLSEFRKYNGMGFQIFQFDALEPGMEAICNRVGIEYTGLPHLKRNSNRGHYREYYTEISKKAVERAFRKEIKEFGYTFDST